jgi:hypothetical protein
LSEGVQSPLPPFDSTRYTNNLKLGLDSTLAAVVCTDTFVTVDTTDTIGTTDTLVAVRRHYALVKLGRPDFGNGTVQVETWFQRISDLRLIQH